MPFLALALSALSVAASTVIPRQNTCLEPDYVDLTPFNGTFLDSAYYAKNTRNISNTFNELSFCEVNGSISYGNNDTLAFTLWLPDSPDYKGRFLAVGNGGMAGVIDYASMLAQLNSGLGFATAGGNAGHLASDNNNGNGAPGVLIPYLHDPDQVQAWIHDAISLFTPAARALVEGYYANPPKYSYYAGCSTGGAQGYALAQYHPNLGFDGIYAGCPGNWYSHLALSFLWNAQHTDTPERNLSQDTLTFIRNAVVEACDTIDGVEDNLIENPLACEFDINTLLCNNNCAEKCLTPNQLNAAIWIYSGPGEGVYPGFSFGSESEWLGQEGDLANAFSIPILQNLVFNNLSYDANTFNWVSDIDILDQKAGKYIDEIDPNIRASFRGKFLTHQGWADPYNAATWPIEHLGQIEKATEGGDVSDWYRLFMVPGGGHCGAAKTYPDVPSDYHFLEALIEWVEGGKAPDEVLSTSADGNGTRKLCPWPKTARFVEGRVGDWESYECE